MKVPTRDGVGLSEVAMSTYFSLSQLLSSLLLPLAGLAVDRCGIRRTALAMMASLALSCLAMSTLVSGGLGVFLGMFAIRLFAKSAELPFKTQVNYHWQHARGPPSPRRAPRSDSAARTLLNRHRATVIHSIATAMARLNAQPR